jgi:hypothetical protein
LEWSDDVFAGQELVLGDSGECEFGWTNRKYDSIYDRLNFAKIQARMMGNATNFRFESVDSKFGHKVLIDVLRGEMTFEYVLDMVIKRHTGASSITWNLPDSAYIDHQSSATEGENTKMFSDETTLKDFLFGSGSFIQGGNDNE